MVAWHTTWFINTIFTLLNVKDDEFFMRTSLVPGLKLLERIWLSEAYTFRPLLLTSLMASLFYPFCRKHCILPITLEMGKKPQLITAFSFVFIYWECHAERAGDGISEALNVKIFWVSMPADSPPGLGLLRRANFSFPPCTFKSWMKNELWYEFNPVMAVSKQINFKC